MVSAGFKGVFAVYRVYTAVTPSSAYAEAISTYHSQDTKNTECDQTEKPHTSSSLLVLLSTPSECRASLENFFGRPRK